MAELTEQQLAKLINLGNLKKFKESFRTQSDGLYALKSEIPEEQIFNVTGKINSFSSPNAETLTFNDNVDYQAIYSAIAAGKIPVITLENDESYEQTAHFYFDGYDQATDDSDFDELCFHFMLPGTNRCLYLTLGNDGSKTIVESSFITSVSNTGTGAIVDSIDDTMGRIQVNRRAMTVDDLPDNIPTSKIDGLDVYAKSSDVETTLNNYVLKTNVATTAEIEALFE